MPMHGAAAAASEVAASEVVSSVVALVTVREAAPAEKCLGNLCQLRPEAEACSVAGTQNDVILPFVMLRMNDHLVNGAALTKEGQLRQGLREAVPVLIAGLGEVRALQLLASAAYIMQHFPSEWKEGGKSFGNGQISCSDWKLAVLRSAWEIVRADADPLLGGKMIHELLTSKADRNVQHAQALILGWLRPKTARADAKPVGLL